MCCHPPIWACQRCHLTTSEVTVELIDIAGRTRMVLTHTGIPADFRGAAGWAMPLDNLATHVDSQDVR
jgi:hypothetical protein